MPAWMAAPSATQASGFTVSRGATPASAATMRRTAGMRVAPPASTTCGARGGSRPLRLQGSGCMPARGEVKQCHGRCPPRHETKVNLKLFLGILAALRASVMKREAQHEQCLQQLFR